MSADDDMDELRLAFSGFPSIRTIDAERVWYAEKRGGGAPDGRCRTMTPEELAQEQEARDRARAEQLREGRAKQLLGDVGTHRRRRRKPYEERCARDWPHLTQEERKATVDLVFVLIEEMALRRAQLEEEWRRRVAGETEPAKLEETEKEFTGRRLEGDELQEARQQVMATKIEPMTNEAAIEIARKRLQEDPSLGVAALHKELEAAGYDRSYSSFYTTIWSKVRPSAPVSRKKKPASTEEPEPSAAAVAEPEPSVAEPAAAEASSSTIEIESIRASLDDDDLCSISIEATGPAALINRIGEIVAAIRAAA